MLRYSAAALCALALCIPLAHSQETTPYAHFEGRQTHPIGLTPGGGALLALNTPDARLSVYDVSNSANATPVLVAEIPVGLEPVSLRARTDDEVWVVNELSDTVSIVSLSRGAVVATLAAPDEPADVVFAQGRAFVSCARSRHIRVFDAETRELINTIALQGDSPRALAVSPDGDILLAAFQLSGNRTTTLASSEAPTPPAPANPALPAPPKTALIVPADDPRVPYTVLDHDVAEIGVLENRVMAYHKNVGTNLLALAFRPGTSEAWIANTEAHNLIRFEPELNGRFASNRVTRLAIPQGDVAVTDLDPPLQNPKTPNAAARALALAQPMGVVFSPDGAHLWLAAFGSDRVAKIDAATGAVLARVDVRLPLPEGSAEENDSGHMRGPRGLALHAAHQRLYVLNKLSNSISVIDAASATDGFASVLAELPVGSHDPTPPQIKRGRGYFNDARLSSHGTLSCATCHIDADRDGLAWDLGDPAGAMLTLTGYNHSIHDPSPKNRVLHPMKGPMTTQTLRGFVEGQTFHWRGDKPTVQSFNSTFPNLLGGTLAEAEDMDALAAYLGTLRHHPNPNRNLDRTLPAEFKGGNPVNGRDLYNSHERSHCITCHGLPTGSDNNIDLMAEVGSTQPVKTPPLRTVYQRADFNRKPGSINISGYGMLKDGTGNFALLPVGHFYVLEALANAQEYKDVESFVLCFDTGTAPAVGHTVTFLASDESAPEKLAALTLLENQAAVARTCDLVARGVINGRQRSFLYDPAAKTYRCDDPAEPALVRADLLLSILEGDALSFMGVLPGQGRRFSIDRDLDGISNARHPAPALDFSVLPESPFFRLRWPASDLGWLLESSARLDTPWQPHTAPRRAPAPADFFWQLDAPAGEMPARFFRLRRTW